MRTNRQNGWTNFELVDGSVASRRQAVDCSMLQQPFLPSVAAANSSYRQLLAESLMSGSKFLIPSQSNQTQIIALNQTSL